MANEASGSSSRDVGEYYEAKQSAAAIANWFTIIFHLVLQKYKEQALGKRTGSLSLKKKAGSNAGSLYTSMQSVPEMQIQVIRKC